MNEVTSILDAIGKGDGGAAAQLLPLVYDELRRLAAQRMAQEKPGQTLQPTALVHEAYLRLVGPGEERPWDNRGHFFGAAAEAMRRILVENARRKRSLKRGGDRQRLDLNPGSTGRDREERRSWLDEALHRLEARRCRQGTAREAPLFRRYDDRTGGRNARHLGHHPRTAGGATPAPGCTRRSAATRISQSLETAEITPGIRSGNFFRFEWNDFALDCA